MKTISRTCLGLLVGLSWLALTPNANGGTIQEQIGRFVDVNTIAVVRMRPAEIDVEASINLVATVSPELGDEFVTNGTVSQASAALEALATAGVEDIYFVMGLGYPLGDFPPIVIPNADQIDKDAIADLMTAGGSSMETIDGSLVFGSKRVLDSVRASSGGGNESFDQAVESAGDGALTLLVVPSPDQMRVLREILPTIPQQLGGGETAPVTEGFQWAAINIDFPPEAEINVVVQASGDEEAATLAQWYKERLTFFANLPDFRREWPELRDSLEMVMPSVARDRLVYSLSQTDDKFKELTALVAAPAQALRRQDARMRSMNDMKVLALAMHNYYDSNDHFPGYASTNEEGEALLSWRVHVLAYIDVELYEEFHLDEPWDSEHNRRLIPRMPEYFLTRTSRLDTEDGRSTVQAPGIDGAIYASTEGMQFKEIRDGTSNTFMLVEIPDAQAVIWTKPLRFNPNLDDPKAIVGGHFDDVFLAALCDGSVQAYTAEIKSDILRAMMTAGGGEIVDTNEIR